MGKTVKTNGYADTHMRITHEVWNKFLKEAKILGRKNNMHFQKILEERYQQKGTPNA